MMTQVKEIVRETRVTVERADGRDLSIGDAQAQAVDAIGAGWRAVDWRRLNYDRVEVVLREAA